MSTVSIKEAALLVGKSRQAINEATRDGILSWKHDGRNRKVIEISELQRVYPLVKTMEELEQSRSVKPPANSPSSESAMPVEDHAVLKERLARAEAEREMLAQERERERRQLEARIEHLESSLEKAQEQQGKAMLLLTDQSKKHESRGAQHREEGEAVKTQLEKLARQNRVLYRKVRSLQEQTLWQRLFSRTTKP